MHARTLAVGLLLGSTAAAQPAPRDVMWQDNAVALRGREGAVVPVRCPAEGTPTTVWGSEVYTDDSSICGAAVHAGIIDAARGGTASVRVLRGLPSYRGSARNGVTSLDYRAFPGSFTFVGIDPSVAIARAMDDAALTRWSDGATAHRGRNGAVVRVDCPAEGTPGTVWGVGPYTDDSSICGAAVHAGVITTGRGGPVAIRIAPGLRAYRGSARFGVTSLAYGAFPGSFVVLRR